MKPDPIPSAAHLFTQVSCVVALAWALGLCLSWILHEVTAGSWNAVLLAVVGVGSGAVAIAAALPGIVMERRASSKSSQAASSKPRAESATESTAAALTTVMNGFFASVAIRLVGTVALAALCSYHLPAAKEQIAGATLAWYLYLATVDVIVLVTFLPRLDRHAVTRSQNAKPSVQ